MVSIKVLFPDRRRENFCKNLNFDKTRSLSGYPVTIADIDIFYDPTIKSPIKFRIISGRILEEILSPLQLKIKIEVVPDGSFTINEDGTEIGSSLLKILNGTFDARVIHQKQRYFGDFWKNEVNLFTRTGVCYVIADKTGSWSDYFEQNYFLFIFVSVVYVCLIIETISSEIFKRYKIEVAMDLLRASIGNATLWEPKTAFKRIIFILVIFSFIIVSSYLQSELTAVIVVTPTEKYVWKK